MLYTVGDYEYAKECECKYLTKLVAEQKLAFANIPEQLKECNITNWACDIYSNKEHKFYAETVKKAARYYVDNFEELRKRGIGMFFYSSAVGSGKTRMAVSIANELLNKGVNVKFATSIQILNEIKNSWGQDDTDENILLNGLSNVDLLIIDDFGVEQAKEWINEKFYHIINSRYLDKLPTIYTCNYSLDNIQYDVRITNRIKEKTFQVPFPEESIREKIGKKNTQLLLKKIGG